MGGPRLTPSAHSGCSGNSVRRQEHGGPPTHPLCPLGVLREHCEEMGTWGAPNSPPLTTRGVHGGPDHLA